MAYLSTSTWCPFVASVKRNIPNTLVNWLSTRQSTSKQFTHLAKQRYVIELRHNCWAYPLSDELSALSLPAQRKYYWLRETDLYCHGKLVMYARAVLNNQIQSKDFFRLKQLHTQPLGQLLHEKQHIQRSAFEVSQLNPKHHLFQLATKKLQHPVTSLWARRSLFDFPRQTLLLTEVMLPDIEAFSICQ